MKTIAIGVAIVHFFTGLDILFGGGAAVLITTPLAFFSKLFDSLIPPVAAISHANMMAMVFIIAALMAVISFLRLAASPWLFMLLLAPQQLLLLSHLMSIQAALFAGQYADGYVPKGGSFFIFADQIWLLMIILIHTREYVKTYDAYNV